MCDMDMRIGTARATQSAKGKMAHSTNKCNNPCFERLGGVATIRCAKLLVSWKQRTCKREKKSLFLSLSLMFFVAFTS